MADLIKGASTRRVQYAALPYRRRGNVRTEVMLVTSLRRGRWIIPKGWPMKRRAPHASAALEALEEAGVVGQVGNGRSAHSLTRSVSNREMSFSARFTYF